MGLRLGEFLDPNFSADRICFTAVHFLELLPKVPHDGFILFDEPAIAMSHRDFMTEINKILMFTLQTFRYKRINVLFALVSPRYMDKTARELCHFQVNVISRGHARIYAIKPSSFIDSSKIRTPFLGEIYTRLPKQALIKEYERIRAVIQESRYKEYLNTLKHGGKRSTTITDLTSAAKQILPNITYTKGAKKGTIDAQALRKALKITISRAYQVKHDLETQK